jgi:hypothetical protein
MFFVIPTVFKGKTLKDTLYSNIQVTKIPILMHQVRIQNISFQWCTGRKVWRSENILDCKVAYSCCGRLRNLCPHLQAWASIFRNAHLVHQILYHMNFIYYKLENGLLVLEKIFKNFSEFLLLLLFPLEEGCFPLFVLFWISFSKGWFVPTLVKNWPNSSEEVEIVKV